MRRTLLFIAFFCWMISPAAFAQLVLSDSILYFEKDQKYQTIYVRNLSHYKTFTVKSIALEVVSPGDPKTELKPVENLLPSPANFIIKPRSEVQVKVFHTREKAMHVQGVYKLRFIPHMEAYQSKENEPLITVITGAGALAFVEPDEKAPKLSWEREGDVLTLINEGNVNVEVLYKDICHSKKETLCYEIPGKRLYPEKTHQFTLPSGFESEEIEIDLMTNMKKQRVKVPVEVWGLE